MLSAMLNAMLKWNPLWVLALSVSLLTSGANASEAGMDCDELAVGATKYVTHYFTPVPATSYLLHRKSENTYEVTLGIDFLTDKGSDIDVELVRKRVARCYREINPFLKDSSGRQLILKLQSTSVDAADRVHSGEVLLSKEVERKNSKHWSAVQDCAVTIHETFHLLGLVDEYRELSNKRYYSDFRLDYSVLSLPTCRAIGPLDSLMHDHAIALVAVQGGVLGWMCTCPFIEGEADGDCVERLSETPVGSRSCPKGAYLEKWGALSLDRYVHGKVERRSNGAGIAKVINYQTEKATRDWLLYPAQVQAVVESGCLARNHLYFACASAAQMRKDSEGSCGDLPTECGVEGSAWLMNPERSGR